MLFSPEPTCSSHRNLCSILPHPDSPPRLQIKLTVAMAVVISFVGLLLLPLGLLHLLMAPAFPSFLQRVHEHPFPPPHQHHAPPASSPPWTNVEGEQVRKRLLEVLASRRRAPVEPPEILPAQPRHRPYLQQEASFVNPEVLALCPKAEGAWRRNTHELEEEDLILRAEAGEQGSIPFLVIRPKSQHSTKERARRPAVIWIWMPFVFDTVWDLIKLVDYLTGRPDIDPARIGMMGISLGGMHTWFAAAADPRIATAVPLIGVQSFGWAIANEKWHARVASIPQVFEVAAQDLGKDEVDSETVAAVWQRLAPGLMDFLDSPQTIPAIAPRPLLIYNGKEDPRCPIQGLGKVLIRSAERYKEAGVPEDFKFFAEEGLAHAVSEEMGDATISWFNKYLRPCEVTPSLKSKAERLPAI